VNREENMLLEAKFTEAEIF
jgi:hypothetical protein